MSVVAADTLPTRQTHKRHGRLCKPARLHQPLPSHPCSSCAARGRCQPGGPRGRAPRRQHPPQTCPCPDTRGCGGSAGWQVAIGRSPMFMGQPARAIWHARKCCGARRQICAHDNALPATGSPPCTKASLPSPPEEGRRVGVGLADHSGRLQHAPAGGGDQGFPGAARGIGQVADVIQLQGEDLPAVQPLACRRGVEAAWLWGCGQLPAQLPMQHQKPACLCCCRPIPGQEARAPDNCAS